MTCPQIAAAVNGDAIAARTYQPVAETVWYATDWATVPGATAATYSGGILQPG